MSDHFGLWFINGNNFRKQKCTKKFPVSYEK